MRGQLRRISRISIALSVLLTGCLDRQSKNPANTAPDQGLSETETPRLTQVSLEPAALRENLEKIFASESSCPATPDVSGRRQLRLLTRDEYNRSVKDIFKIWADYRGSIPIEQKVLGFRNSAPFALVSADHASGYDKTAKELAPQLVSVEWSRLMTCKVADGASCAEQFIRKFGPKIWRRPISDDDVKGLLRVHQVGSDISPEAGMELVIRALLVSPNFLYRSETGQDGKLTAFEMASALSYFFWGTTPDDELLKLADNGSLLQDQILLQQAQRLLQDERAKEGMKAFADAWLNYTAVLSVNKDATKFPDFDGLRLPLATETENFFDYLVRKKAGTYNELLTADYSIGDQKLAAFYRAQMDNSDGVTKLRFPDQPRAGLLGHGAILASLAYATETGPIQRGKFVREHLLCDILMPPPPNLMVKPPPPKEGATTRERFAAHTAVTACRGCHVKIDGIGFAMEDFDTQGLYRTMDNGKPVDASGQVYALDGRNVDINGAKELSVALASSNRAKQCLAIQVWRMAQGRLETADDVCTLRQLSGRFAQENTTLAQLLIQVITDPSYTQRSR